MSRKKATAVQPPATLLESLRHFLTPAVWKQGQQGARKGKQRWTLQPLVLALLAMTWCLGDSESERFQTARAFAASCLRGRKQPGKTLQGFQKALAKLPLLALRNLARGVRGRLQELLGERWQTGGWVVLGCDGSRLECPRTTQLEARLGQCSKDHSAPMLWVTALVHLATGTLWSWQLGRGTASELEHLSRLLVTLPAEAVLLVADAAYCSFALLRDILERQASFLIRLSSRTALYTRERQSLKRWREGVVYYWPKEMQAKQQPPIQARLIRVRGDQADVWLLTNVLPSVAERPRPCPARGRSCWRRAAKSSGRSPSGWGPSSTRATANACSGRTANCAAEAARKRVVTGHAANNMSRPNLQKCTS